MFSTAVNVSESKNIIQLLDKADSDYGSVTNLSEAEINQEYIIKQVKTDDEDMTNFLFTLGCFKGESVTLISKLAENYVITVKDARYSICTDLAEAIII